MTPNRSGSHPSDQTPVRPPPTPVVHSPPPSASTSASALALPSKRNPQKPPPYHGSRGSGGFASASASGSGTSGTSTVASTSTRLGSGLSYEYYASRSGTAGTTTTSTITSSSNSLAVSNLVHAESAPPPVGTAAAAAAGSASSTGDRSRKRRSSSSPPSTYREPSSKSPDKGKGKGKGKGKAQGHSMSNPDATLTATIGHGSGPEVASKSAVQARRKHSHTKHPHTLPPILASTSVSSTSISTSTSGILGQYENRPIEADMEGNLRHGVVKHSRTGMEQSSRRTAATTSSRPRSNVTESMTPSHNLNLGSSSSHGTTAPAPAPASTPTSTSGAIPLAWFAIGEAPTRDKTGWSSQRDQGWREGWEDALRSVEAGRVGVHGQQYFRPLFVRREIPPPLPPLAHNIASQPNPSSASPASVRTLTQTSSRHQSHSRSHPHTRHRPKIDPCLPSVPPPLPPEQRLWDPGLPPVPYSAPPCTRVEQDLTQSAGGVPKPRSSRRSSWTVQAYAPPPSRPGRDTAAFTSQPLVRSGMAAAGTSHTMEVSSLPFEQSRPQTQPQPQPQPQPPSQPYPALPEPSHRTGSTWHLSTASTSYASIPGVASGSPTTASYSAPQSHSQPQPQPQPNSHRQARGVSPSSPSSSTLSPNEEKSSYPSSSHKTSTTARQPQPRQIISCFPCRSRKLKCDGQKPCSQCVRKGEDEVKACEYAKSVRRRGKGRKPTDPQVSASGTATAMAMAHEAEQEQLDRTDQRGETGYELKHIESVEEGAEREWGVDMTTTMPEQGRSAADAPGDVSALGFVESPKDLELEVGEEIRGETIYYDEPEEDFHVDIKEEMS